MKRLFALMLTICLLTGCSANESISPTEPQTLPEETQSAELQPEQTQPQKVSAGTEAAYPSRFDTVTDIVMSDSGISVDDAGETETVYTSRDIVYYEDKDTYESGNPYGEGEEWERHSAEEADAHTVVNITAPGAYRVFGKLSAGQIRVDLGETAYEDPDAVVELILSDADITCTVAPAVLFLNVYECDGQWSTETAQADMDTSAAGIYDVATVTAYDGGTQMAYTGTDVRMGPGGFGGGQKPEGAETGGERLEGMEPPEEMEWGERPEKTEGMEHPEGFAPGQTPEGMELPEDFDPAEIPEDGMGGRGERGDFSGEPGESNTSFYMQDKVNFFSGLASV